MPMTVFTTCPRSADVDVFRSGAKRTFALTESAGFTGVLIYTGNDVVVEPWFLAHELVREHPRLIPLIAVNPIYMHPFTVARYVSAIATVYARRCYLNLVAGTALSDLDALDEAMNHDERYMRLREFAEIIVRLCANAVPLTYEGEHYAVVNLQLRPPVPRPLRPGLFVAGQSPAAVDTAARLGACNLGMLQPNLAVHPATARAVHFGLVCRSTDDEAWRAARELFPPDARGERMQRFSTQNTDAAWKSRMLHVANQTVESSEGYWLDPFRRFQADCPVLVGSVERVARMLRGIAEQGVDHLVLELPPSGEDYQHAAQAIKSALGTTVVAGNLSIAS
jgi:alkanesulfonate monooxygenase